MRPFVLRESARIVCLVLLGWVTIDAAERTRASMDQIVGPQVPVSYWVAVCAAVGFVLVAIALWGETVPPRVGPAVLAVHVASAAAVVAILPVMAARPSASWTNAAMVTGGWMLAAIWLAVALYRLVLAIRGKERAPTDATT